MAWLSAIWFVGTAGIIMTFINISPIVKISVLGFAFLIFDAGIIHLTYLDEK